MSRYLGPKLKIIRRLGILPGLTNKKMKRAYPPGQHGRGKLKIKKSISDYVIRLKEKQKLRFYYGISEKQLYNYVKEARRLKGVTGTLLLQLIEMRLDNTIYRLGFAPTIPSARQLVIHRHIFINGKNVNIPSFQCKSNDVITVKKNIIPNIINNLKITNFRFLPFHLTLDNKKIIGKINSSILRKNVGLTINDLLIIEFYSRK